MSKLFRFKCPKCGQVEDFAKDSTCSKCGSELKNDGEGMVQIYRMGSPIGVAVGYGIYINEKPYGHLGNKESIRIPLPYGTYKFHFTCGMTRNCDDITITLSPDKPNVYMKARIKAGFWTNKIIPELVAKEEMPEL